MVEIRSRTRTTATAAVTTAVKTRALSIVLFRDEIDKYLMNTDSEMENNGVKSVALEQKANVRDMDGDVAVVVAVVDTNEANNHIQTSCGLFTEVENTIGNFLSGIYFKFQFGCCRLHTPIKLGI